MLDCGLGVQQRFEFYAKGSTRNYVLGWITPVVIRDESTVRNSLSDYFQMVNEFNLDYHQFLHPTRPIVDPLAEVYKPITSDTNCSVNADLMITCGTNRQQIVGLGEIKCPWVVTPNAIQRFMVSLPFSDFGGQFIAREPPHPRSSIPEAREEHRQNARMGKALTQLYNDMINDGRTVGFLATTERIVYCFIPPENRRHLSIYVNTCYRAETGWGPSTSPARRFSPQVGLAAWLASTFYSAEQPQPPGLKKYCNLFKSSSKLTLRS
jgi:hypothetical protein